MRDIFEKIQQQPGPIGQHKDNSHGYYTFPKLTGEIGPRMQFHGQDMLVWSLNNYLGLANHPEVRKADTNGTAQYGLGSPMGARMMTGNTELHEQLENELAAFVKKEAGLLVNYGYQGVVSAIDCLVDRRDVIVYDAESHACIIDGVRLHMGKRFVYPHNDMESLEKQLQRATKLANEQGGGILVITEGVFGMSGDQGRLKDIVALKEKYSFRLFVDDAHGVGVMGETGAGTHQAQGVVDEVDIYFGTFAKSFALIGGFFASTPQVTEYLRYNMRSQIFAKSLPMPLVVGLLKRLELMRNHPEYRQKLWDIVNRLQNGLRNAGFDLGVTQSPVTPVYMKGGLNEATNLIKDVRENYKIFCSMVMYPVIPKGQILLRLIPTAAHSFEDVDYTLSTFTSIKNKLEAGEYKKEGNFVEWF